MPLPGNAMLPTGGGIMPLQIGIDAQTEEAVVLADDALLRHVVILGATGAGKTVLGKAFLEEAVRAGVPVIAVDPQGDLASLALRPTPESAEAHPGPRYRSDAPGPEGPRPRERRLHGRPAERARTRARRGDVVQGRPRMDDGAPERRLAARRLHRRGRRPVPAPPAEPAREEVPLPPVPSGAQVRRGRDRRDAERDGP